MTSARTLAREMTDRMSEHGPGRSRADQSGLLSQATDAVMEHGGAALDTVSDASKQSYVAARRFVREQPIAALAGALAAGAAVGALWKMTQRQNTYARQIQRYGEPYLRQFRQWRW